MEKPEKTAAIVFAYNEAQFIEPLLLSLKKLIVAGENKPLLGSIIVVDDGSTDQTAAIARNAGVKIVQLKENRGKAFAFYKGVKEAYANGATTIVTLDADLQPVSRKQIETLLRPLQNKGVDMTKGTVAGDATYLSGQRAIKMKVLEPLLHQARKWRVFLGIRNGRPIYRMGYGLERALNTLIKRCELVETAFETQRGPVVKSPQSKKVQVAGRVRFFRVYDAYQRAVLNRRKTRTAPKHRA